LRTFNSSIILAVLVFFLISPIKCDISSFFGNAYESVKEFLGVQQKSYIPSSVNNTVNGTDGSVQDPKCQPSNKINYLDEVKLNTTEWKCIDEVLRNATNDPGNFTSLLLTAVNETIFDQIKDCYADKTETDLFAWWKDWWNYLIQTEYWKFVFDYRWHIIVAVVAFIVFMTCLCKLCCTICKKKNDDDIIE